MLKTSKQVNATARKFKSFLLKQENLKNMPVKIW